MGHKSWYSVVAGVALLIIIPGRNALFAHLQETTAGNPEARKVLNDGVEAYKRGRTDEAIEDFKKAKDLDPSLTNAQLFLAVAYSSQYVPGAPSPENIRYGEQALEQFKEILENHPSNLSAIDGAGAILYNMASTPYNLEKMEESKAYEKRHIEIRPDDPEPYYWIGVIDWSIVYRANKDLREEWMKQTSRDLQPADALPEEIRREFGSKYGDTVQEGIDSLKKAMTHRPDYDDAKAYLNLLYRQKADMESAPILREDDLKTADDLVDQVKAHKEKELEQREQPQ
jgi:tetratricopeptide (TPR) repeat protein